jgi:hypothetical protein
MTDIDFDKLEIIRNVVIVAGFTVVVIFTVSKILLEKRWLKKRGIKAEGVVIELVEKVVKGNYRNKFVDTITYYPVIKYTTHNWEHLTKQYDTDFNSSVYKVGDKVSLVYDSKNPERFIIEYYR